MRRIVLKSFQSPGDIVMLTAAVRDLHAAAPGAFQTDVRTSADDLWRHNPHLTPLKEAEPGVETLDMHYPLVHQSNQRPYHFLHGYVQFLEERLGLRIPLTRFQGDIHLTEAEKQSPLPAEWELPERFWIVIAGGKYDFTAKWWNPACYQQVVDRFRGTIPFVQCGEQGHWHPPLNGVVSLIGKTTLRDFVRLMHHAEGVLCPVTLAMHLAAAVETIPGRPKHRPCVVVAGGREPPHWEAYPHHQFLSTVGAFSCCADGGCWRSRCQLVGDGDDKDRRNVCEQPVEIAPDLRIPRCMEVITSADVIRRIELYYLDGVLHHGNGQSGCNGCKPAAKLDKAQPMPDSVIERPPMTDAPIQGKTTSVLIEFRHGLGDAVQLTLVLKHLQHYHPDWNVDVAALTGKHSAFHGHCRQVFRLDRDDLDRSVYNQVYSLNWHENHHGHSSWPSTKASRCLLEDFRLTPLPELCRYEIRHCERVTAAARGYLAEICPQGPGANGKFPTVLIHYEGNTSGDKKNLPHELVREVCETVLSAGYVPVVLDWDRRSPLPDGERIHCPAADHPLWNGTGTGDAETLAALIEAAALMIGVDSGPLHVAGATGTPTIGVWTHHHPVHYFDLANNVTHFVPGDHEKYAANGESLAFFRQHYRHQTYKQLFIDLAACVESALTGKDFERIANERFLKQLSTTVYGERYYDEHRLAGLDYLGHGEWQQQYGRWFVESLGLQGKKLLDVGCACGSILRGLGKAGTVVQGVDVNEYMIRLGRDKWPDMAPLLFICDAVNLHLYADETWDAIHTAQVAEHWKPELVPHILRELCRVAVPEGLLFCALDTEELFQRQSRTVESEDPTHVCIRSISWWHERLTEAGWQVCSDEFARPLQEHPEGFLKRYDWDWFVARKNG